MAKQKGKPKAKGIPAEVQEQAEEVVAKFNKEILKNGEIEYTARFKGNYLHLDRRDFGSKPDPICRLKYTGDFDDWDFAIYKYSDGAYDPDEWFPGDDEVDGTIEGAMRVGLKAYPA